VKSTIQAASISTVHCVASHRASSMTQTDEMIALKEKQEADI